MVALFSLLSLIRLKLVFAPERATPANPQEQVDIVRLKLVFAPERATQCSRGGRRQRIPPPQARLRTGTRDQTSAVLPNDSSIRLKLVFAPERATDAFAVACRVLDRLKLGICQSL